MQLASVRIFVTDLEAAARFYGDVVGLGESSRSGDALIYGDDIPMVVVELADKEAHDEKLVGRFTGVAFATDDASALHRSLTARGIATDGPPEKALGWHFTSCQRSIRQHDYVSASRVTEQSSHT